MHPSDPQKIIVAIHGVGALEKGEVAKGLAKGLGIPDATQDTLIVKGIDYQRVSTIDGRITIIEVNWSDVIKPAKKWWELLKQAGLINTSMLSLAELRWRKRFPGKLDLFRYFRFTLEAMTPGAVFFSLLTVLGMVISNRLYAAVVCLSIAAFFGWFTYKASRYSKDYRFGWGWLILFVLYVFTLLFPGIRGNALMKISFVLRECVQLPTTVLSLVIFACYLYLFVKEKKKDAIAAEFSFTYLPFIAFNSAAALLAFLSLGVLKTIDEKAVTEWDKAARAFIHFDLAGAELVTTVIFSAIGVIPLVYTIVYLQWSKKPGSGTVNARGRLAQQALSLLVRVSPVLLLLLSCYLTCLVIAGGKKADDNQLTIYEIYRTSILRTIPFFSWFVGPLATITLVIGDILFYIQPDEKAKHAIREKCLERLQNAMEYAHSMPSAEKIVVAHSWGTVVAVDYLYQHPSKVRLVTLGSPLESLCHQFLGEDVKTLSQLTGWINAYRYGDYIAGPLDQGPRVEDQLLGDGGHMNYWEDKALAGIILTAPEI